MGKRLEAIASYVLTVMAVVIGGTLVYRTFFARPVGFEEAVPAMVEDWREGATASRIPYAGSGSEPVEILVVADLECPACRAFHANLKSVLQSRGKDVQVAYVHYPLSYHRSAMAAARGADCARTQGRFREWVDAIYSEQDSLGHRSWGRLAMDAGIADTAAIAECAGRTDTTRAIAAGLDFGTKVGVKGTPTILVNGWRLPRPPSAAQLDSIITRVQQGKALD